jgi:hypothetical protein
MSNPARESSIPDDARTWGAERESDTDLALLTADGVAGHAVQTDRRQPESEHAEESRQQRQDALLRQQAVQLGALRPERQGQVRVHLILRFANRAALLQRCPGGRPQEHREALIL